jgi:rare lipoprotein A
VHTLTPCLLALTIAACSASPQRPVRPEAFTPTCVDPVAATSAQEPDAATATSEPAPMVQTGICSWYGPNFHGRTTSNGETFDQHKMTAAHPSLPFGTNVEVTDLDTGRKVRVRINDRGPYADDRILDLSRGAATSLGVIKKGTANVEVRILGSEFTEWPQPRYSVQLGAYKDSTRARKRIAKLLEKDELSGPYYVREPGNRSPTYRVRIGPFRGYSHAIAEARALRSAGIIGLIVEEDLRPREQFGEMRDDDAIVQASPAISEDASNSQAK